MEENADSVANNPCDGGTESGYKMKDTFGLKI